MNQQPDDLGLPPTRIVSLKNGPSSQDFASVRTEKRALVAQAQSDPAKGEAPTPDQLLAQWPTDPKMDEDVASLLFHDFCRRRRQEPDLGIEEYEERFPEHKNSLARLVQHQALLQSLGDSDQSGPELRLPEVGERVFGFRLLYELGRGSFARVFLAEQADLAGRPVVLKVSDRQGHEPQTLAQLQHTNIVPIHSVHEDSRAALRVACMPYFGGASLSAILRMLGDGIAAVRSGDQLVRALEAAQVPPRSVLETLLPGHSLTADQKTLFLLRSWPYPQAAAWVVARLAEGLQHSHRRGVLHRDVKPANVLLGADGQPMLLDFNLAQQTRHEPIHAVIGGTVAYMAPEHLRSLATRDPALARLVDHRADVYSLGMVLFEMLTGHSPFTQSASNTRLPILIESMATERSRTVPSLRQHRPDVAWSLESILRKCLAPDPAKRYQEAGHLAEDLQRFLEDLPLRHAPELSPRERCAKWARRHPRLTAAGMVTTVAVSLLLALGSALAGAHQLLAETRENLSDTREHLDRARAQDRKRAFEAGTVQALCLVNTTVPAQDHLPQGLAACEATLALYQVLERDDWQQQTAWQYLADSEHRQLAEDVRELLLLLAWGRVKAAPGQPEALRQALALLDRCEALAELRPLRAMWEDRASYLEQLGQREQAQAARTRAAQIQPASARDHYLLATSFARQARYADAVAQLDEALRLNPRHYWSLVQRGLCHKELGELLLAAGDFSRCVGLQPDFAWGHYTLGCILDEGQKLPQAIESYSAAIRCDRDFAPAYHNRGQVFLKRKQFAAALVDLNRAAVLGRHDALLHAGRGAALEGLGQTQEADAAFTLAQDRAAKLPPSLQADLLLRYGFSVYKRLPKGATTSFNEVLRRQPHHPEGLYGRAMVLVEQGREAEAIGYFTEALQHHPSFVAAQRFRAVLLARRGDLAAASQDVNRCLAQEPGAGVTLYAAACVLALASEQAATPTDAREREDQALALLQKALAQGYGRDIAATDADLRALRRRPEFSAMLKAARPKNH